MRYADIATASMLSPDHQAGSTALADGDLRAVFGEDAHGIAGWPFGEGAHRDIRPATLPDGRSWPRVRVLTVPRPGDDGLTATVASVVGQGYPESRHDVVGPGPASEAAIAAAMSDQSIDYLLFLRAGDLLAPGALTALCLEAILTGADVVVGLRVLFDRGVLGLDVLAHEPGPLAGMPRIDDGPAPFTGGEMLLAREAAARAGGLDPAADLPMAGLWPRLAATGARLSRIGRPVLLQRVPGGLRESNAGPGLSIAALTDGGYGGGGAGIAHRRLTEALRLSGHRVTDIRLTDESSSAAAEWTERFPKTEAAIRTGGYDLVLAGGLHGATRRTSLLSRLRESVPVAAVMHDLFLVTGRCASPGECGIIATGCDSRCPSSSAYPQLAPDRIADAYAGKRAALSAGGPVLLLANSTWTEGATRALAPSGTDVARIDLAFPAGVFRPCDRTETRRQLGLPPGDVLVMFAAVIADAPSKGFGDLTQALRRVARPGVGFVAVGRFDNPAVLGLPNLVAVGPVDSEAELARWYGACDIYVTASRTETFGQTPVEAGLCGTPTLAYGVTGLTSAVIDGVSGLLVAVGPDALADTLAALIADEPARQRLGASARIALESRYSHAAAAMRMHAVLEARGIVPATTDGRIRFSPELLARFAFAKDRHPGVAGMVAAPSRPFVRNLRRAKQALLGRGMPLWMRRMLYAAALVRRSRGARG